MLFTENHTCPPPVAKSMQILLHLAFSGRKFLETPVQILEVYKFSSIRMIYNRVSKQGKFEKLIIYTYWITILPQISCSYSPHSTDQWTLPGVLTWDMRYCARLERHPDFVLQILFFQFDQLLSPQKIKLLFIQPSWSRTEAKLDLESNLLLFYLCSGIYYYSAIRYTSVMQSNFISLGKKTGNNWKGIISIIKI